MTAKRTYEVGYIASNGQPVNGLVTETSYTTAVARARGYAKTCLLQRSGGIAYVDEIGRDEPPQRRWIWIEHAEGGFGTQYALDGSDRAVRL